jgi:thiol:disulfide interchange protein DsbC
MLKPIAALLVGLVAGAAHAQSASETTVRSAIKSLVPNAEIESVNESVLPGFSEVVMNGQVIYVTNDGKYVVSGAVFDVAGKANLTERRLASLRATELEKVPPERRLIFPAKSPKHRIMVFTDIDCGYCRQFHADIAKYNDLGITVEYLFFPRMGEGSKGWNEAVQVWCSKDRNDALTRAKAGQKLDAKTDCDNPVKEDFVLGQRIGVSGTPAIFTESGTQVGGYLPPDQMIARLEQDKATRK